MRVKAHKFCQLMSAVGSPDWRIYWWLERGVAWLSLAALASTHGMYTVDIIMVSEFVWLSGNNVSRLFTLSLLDAMISRVFTF